MCSSSNLYCRVGSFVEIVSIPTIMICPLMRWNDTNEKSDCGPPPAGSTHTNISSFSGGAGGSWENISSMSAGRKHCCKLSNARPESSDSMRSGLSCITVFNLLCLSDDCQRGTKWSKCTQSVALPSSLHFAHASSTWRTVNSASPVALSFKRIKRV